MKILNTIDSAISYLKKVEDVMKLKPSEVSYTQNSIDVLKISHYNIDTNIEELTSLKSIYKELFDKDIDLEKEYFVNLENELEVYFMFNPELNGLRPYFYIKDGAWIYNKVYSSWSGMNEVITNFICERYEYNKNYGFNNWASGYNTVKSKMKKLNFPYKDDSYSKKEEHYKELSNNVIDLYNLITDKEFLNIIGRELKELFDTLKQRVGD